MVGWGSFFFFFDREEKYILIERELKSAPMYLGSIRGGHSYLRRKAH